MGQHANTLAKLIHKSKYNKELLKFEFNHFKINP